MKILVCTASRYGSTEEIARAISAGLRSTLATTEKRTVIDLLHVRQVGELDEYDAVVIGSAVYMGCWMRQAREFVTARSAALTRRPVWLFSSGPIGDPLRPVEPPKDVAEMMWLTRARDHKLFNGCLDKRLLTFGEKAIVRMVGATEGDCRDWPDINAWAVRIANALTVESAPWRP